MKTAIQDKAKKQSRKRKAGRREHPVLISAYDAILEAVAEEQYEELRSMVGIAWEFGASHWDVQEVLGLGIVEQRRRAFERRKQNG